MEKLPRIIFLGRSNFQYREGVVCKHIRAYRIVKALQKADRQAGTTGWKDKRCKL